MCNYTLPTCCVFVLTGGSVDISEKGVARVVWERKKPGYDSPMYHVPFLAMSRALGDYWSYNQLTKMYIVSSEPDVDIHKLDTSKQRFLVVASDGLWDVISAQEVVDFVWAYENRKNEEKKNDEKEEEGYKADNVVRALINEALNRWMHRRILADNISVIIVFLTELK